MTPFEAVEGLQSVLRYIHYLAAIHTVSSGVTPICDQSDESATMPVPICDRNSQHLEPFWRHVAPEFVHAGRLDLVPGASIWMRLRVSFCAPGRGVGAEICGSGLPLSGGQHWPPALLSMPHVDMMGGGYCK